MFFFFPAGGQQLAVSDADTAPDDLEFELVDAPIHGELMRRDDNIRMSNGNQDDHEFLTQERRISVFKFISHASNLFPK